MMKSHKRDRKVENEAIDWLVRLQSPSCSDAEDQAFFQWLSESDQHQQAYLVAEQLYEAGSLLQQAKQQSLARPRPVLAYWGAGLAAACLLVVCVLVMLPPRGVAAIHLATEFGEQKTITLADDSNLVLNTNTRVEVAYSDEQRKLVLAQGEIYIKVAHEKHRRLTVYAEGMAITAVGTQFGVLAERGQIIVTVTEGKVAVQVGDTNTYVSAGQQISLHALLAGEAPQSVDADAVNAWRNGLLVLQGETLEQVLAELGRYYRVDIQLADPAMGRKTVIANIRLGNLEATLQALAFALGLELNYEQQSQTAILSPPSN